MVHRSLSFGKRLRRSRLHHAGRDNFASRAVQLAAMSGELSLSMSMRTEHQARATLRRNGEIFYQQDFQNDEAVLFRELTPLNLACQK